jgi:hypothetical protein
MATKLTRKKMIGMGVIVGIAVLAMLWVQSKLNSIMGLMWNSQRVWR